jgi:two-component system NarL family sensor kinase
VAAFAALGVGAIIVVAAVAALAIRDITDDEALREAKQLTRVTALSAVTPDLTDQVLTGSPSALARLERTVRTRVLRSPVVRVKLWTLGGRIVYSDARPLIGRRFALDQGQRRAVQTGVVAADLSHADEPENVFERGLGKLLEVYLRVRTPDGHPLLYEEYFRFGAVADNSRREWLALLPAFGGALVVLGLAQLPLAWWLARRLQQREQEREALLVHLVDSSDRERRRLAQAVHEGPVQALAGVAWRLSAAARGAPSPLRGELDETASDARRAQRELRTLLVSLHPPNLARVGLRAALSDAAAPLREAGVDVELDLPALDLEPDAEALVYRVAEEGLRNAQRHAGATHVEVRLRRGDGQARLRVRDDGRGFTDDELTGRHAVGHRGLALLRDLAADAGGDLTLESSPGNGTTMELVL